MEKCEEAKEALWAQKKRTSAVVAASTGTFRCSPGSNAEIQLESCGYDVMNVIVASKPYGASEGI